MPFSINIITSVRILNLYKTLKKALKIKKKVLKILKKKYNT